MEPIRVTLAVSVEAPAACYGDIAARYARLLEDLRHEYGPDAVRARRELSGSSTPRESEFMSLGAG